MHRTHHTFSLLQAVAAVAILAITLWSIGWPAIRTAEAANVISFSDTLSDSTATSSANHTISFVTPSGMAEDETITLTFANEFTIPGTLDYEDVDVTVNGAEKTLAAAQAANDWTVTVGGQTIDITSGTDAAEAIGANATVTIEIGTNATAGVTGAEQIDNPGSTGSYEIDVLVGSGGDTGTTRVAIVDEVTVTASVDTTFDFTVAGVAAGEVYSGTATTTGATTPTAIPFGLLEADTASTAAQELQVETNAANGFVVTVQADGQLISANGADIDAFDDGAYTAENSPVLWNSPGALVSDENSWGHWGLTTNDDTLTENLNDIYGNNDFASASTSPTEVFRHDGPIDNTGSTGEYSTRVAYRVQITPLQEAADDYTATLTYVATPVF